MMCLCILAIKPLLVASSANIFSHSKGCLFILSMVSFAVQKLVSLIRSHLFIFAFLSIALGDWPKKTLVWFMSENVLPVFSSRSLMALCLMFKSLITLSLFLCMVWVCVLTSLIYTWLSSFPTSPCWRDCLLPIVYSCLLCERLIDIGVWVYFWVYLYSVPLVQSSHISVPKRKSFGSWLAKNSI